MSKSPQDCPQWDSCSAPLCPLDEESLKHGVFYPDEPICTSKKFGRGKLFIKNQRKIAQKIKQENMDTSFTYQMLNRHFVVGRAIRGLNRIKTRLPNLTGG